MKETVDIKKHDNKKNIEYRAIVVDDNIVSFDYSASDLPSPYESDIYPESIKIIKSISRKGFQGAYFMDFALTENGEVIIVECKDISNGTIKNVSDFGEGVCKLYES